MSETFKFEPVSRNSESDGGEGEHDPHFEPIIRLPLIKVSTNEEDEDELCKIRARLYRFDKVDHEWKERGTGDIKLLHHCTKHTVRIVMRRDKTLKLCANHFLTPDMQLKQHIGSDRAFNWTTFGDFADETAKQEFLAIKFGNVDNAKLWKEKFLEAQEIVKTKCTLYNNQDINESNSSLSNQSDSEENTSSVSEDSQSLQKENLVNAENKKNLTKDADVSKESIDNEKNGEKVKEDGVVIKLSELSVKSEEVVN